MATGGGPGLRRPRKHADRSCAPRQLVSMGVDCGPPEHLRGSGILQAQRLMEAARHGRDSDDEWRGEEAGLRRAVAVLEKSAAEGDALSKWKLEEVARFGLFDAIPPDAQLCQSLERQHDDNGNDGNGDNYSRAALAFSEQAAETSHKRLRSDPAEPVQSAGFGFVCDFPDPSTLPFGPSDQMLSMLLKVARRSDELMQQSSSSLLRLRIDRGAIRCFREAQRAEECAGFDRNNLVFLTTCRLLILAACAAATFVVRFDPPQMFRASAWLAAVFHVWVGFSVDLQAAGRLLANWRLVVLLLANSLLVVPLIYFLAALLVSGATRSPQSLWLAQVSSVGFLRNSTNVPCGTLLQSCMAACVLPAPLGRCVSSSLVVLQLLSLLLSPLLATLWASLAAKVFLRQGLHSALSESVFSEVFPSPYAFFRLNISFWLYWVALGGLLRLLWSAQFENVPRLSSKKQAPSVFGWLDVLFDRVDLCAKLAQRAARSLCLWGKARLGPVSRTLDHPGPGLPLFALLFQYTLEALTVLPLSATSSSGFIVALTVLTLICEVVGLLILRKMLAVFRISSTTDQLIGLFFCSVVLQGSGLVLAATAHPNSMGANVPILVSFPCALALPLFAAYLHASSTSLNSSDFRAIPTHNPKLACN